jgi:GDP-4-dehydro-6-deoxy-D-mannose reductase
MRAIVTGATGFVGGHLIEHLAQSGDTIVGLSRHGRWPAGSEGLARLARLEACDLVDADSSGDRLVKLLASKQPEAIYHLAAQSNPQASVEDPRGTWLQNLVGTLNLLEAVKESGQRPRIVLVGSGVSYGNPAPEHLPVNESCPLRPNNPYAASKAAADLLGIQHFLAHGTHTVMARPFNHAGPRQSDRYVLSSFARQVAEVEAGKRPRVETGNLDVVRDFTDVRDIVRAYRLLILHGQPGEIYNIGTGRDVKLSAMLDILRGLARVPIEVHIDPARLRPVDQPRLLADATKLQAATGWEPAFSIEQTLADMLEAWRETLSSGRITRKPATGGGA